MERRDSVTSRHGKGTVGEFFTGGNKDLDAGMVALGSGAHMLEDSFAGSHAARSDNLYLDTNRDTALSLTGQEIANKSTPIMTNADYTKQDHFLIWGRHSKADKINDAKKINGESHVDTKLRETQGGSLARDTAAQWMLMNSRMKQIGEWTGGGAREYTGSSLDKFIQGVTQVDETARNVGVTSTGRGYAQKYSPQKTDNKKVRAGINEYWSRTEENIVGNKHTTAAIRAGQLDSEIGAIENILEEGSDETKAHFRPHAGEMYANICSMISQINASHDADPDALEALENQRDRLARLLQIGE
jgi:hypothetical protein